VGRNQKAAAAAAATPRSHYIESLLDPDEIVIDETFCTLKYQFYAGQPGLMFITNKNIYFYPMSGDDLTVRKLTLERIQEVVSGSELTPSLTFYLNEGSVINVTGVEDQDRILSVINEQLRVMTAITRPSPSHGSTVNIPLEGELSGETALDYRDEQGTSGVARHSEGTSVNKDVVRGHQTRSSAHQHGSRQVAVAFVSGNSAFLMKAHFSPGMQGTIVVNTSSQQAASEEPVRNQSHQQSKSAVLIEELPSDTEESETQTKMRTKPTGDKFTAETASKTSDTLPELVPSPVNSGNEEEEEEDEHINLMPDPEDMWMLNGDDVEPQKRTFSVDSTVSSSWDKNAAEKARKKKPENYDDEKDIDTTEYEETLPQSSENESPSGIWTTPQQNSLNNETGNLHDTFETTENLDTNERGRRLSSSSVESSSSNLPDPNTDPLLALMTAFSRMQGGSMNNAPQGHDIPESSFGGHCPYFMSGYCHNGSNCPMNHGDGIQLSDIVEDNPDDENVGGIQLLRNILQPRQRPSGPSDLKCYSIVFCDLSEEYGDIENTDSVILPRGLSTTYFGPLAFRVENPSNGKFIYGGLPMSRLVSYHEDKVFLPQWMMEHLEVEDSAHVTVTEADLPSGQFVRFQPLSSAFLCIPLDQRQTILEFQLRRYSTLTQGTVIQLSHELNTYALKVLECKPAESIIIREVDLATDFTEPLDFEDDVRNEHSPTHKLSATLNSDGL
jgi:hypothetical protein